MLVVFGAPCQLGLLAGQEHGRTIPLGDITGHDQLRVMEEPRAFRPLCLRSCHQRLAKWRSPAASRPPSALLKDLSPKRLPMIVCFDRSPQGLNCRNRRRWCSKDPRRQLDCSPPGKCRADDAGDDDVLQKYSYYRAHA